MLFCCASPVAGERRSCARWLGTSVTGDLVDISNKAIVIKTATDQVVTPLEQAVDLKLADIRNPGQDSKYADVELTDGTLLHCTQFVIKGKEVELTLLANLQVKVPLGAISFIQRDANEEKTRSEWKERFLNRKRSHDLIIARVKPAGTAEDVLDAQEGTLGNADEEGKSIEFLTASGARRMLALSRMQGMIFQRGPDPNAAPVLCKFYDTQANLLMVSSLAWNDKKITITTPAGATINFPIDLVGRLDFSKGKLTYLSDDAFWKNDKVKVIQSSTEDHIEKPRRDKNLDDLPIRLGGTPYVRGLSAHSRTKMEFALNGDYREFKAVIGVDDQLEGDDSPTVVTIEGDGRELLTLTITRKDKPRPVTLNIKDVQRLRLVVGSGDLLDLGKHVDFADAKVSK